MRPFSALVLCVLCTCTTLLAAADTPEGLAFYEKEIAPLLVKTCGKCHGAEAIQTKKIKGKYLMDSWAAMVKGGESGKASVVPGNLDKSTIIEAIRWKNEDTAMPPKEKLPPAAIAAIEKWVQMGAPHPDKK